MSHRSAVLGRREFLLGVGATLASSADLYAEVMGKPDLTFGVLSDIHVTTPKSAWRLEKALAYMKERGVDAVMISGDLSDWGLVSGLKYVKETWDRVFEGSGVVPLFCTGNHEYRGWRYSNLTMAMHASGYSEAERLSKAGMEKCWKEIFGEDFAPVRLRTVKGYDFVSTEWGNGDKLAQWMEENGKRLEGERPFFYFQHAPIGGTVSGGEARGPGDDKAKPVLDRYPNCVAFTGHTHKPFFDARSVWQGEFTAFAVPSLSYAYLPKWHENGEGGSRDQQKRAMPRLPSRLNLNGGLGYVVSVWKDRLVVERRDFLENAVAAPDWVVPLPACRGAAPYATAVRKDAEPVPAFPEGAELCHDIRIYQNRAGATIAVVNCEFPSAVMPEGSRVADYEIRAVPLDRKSAPVAKCFVSPAWGRLAKYEPAFQQFWFDAAELPQDVDYVLEVRARNYFGKASRPLVSETLHVTPGLAEIDPKL